MGNGTFVSARDWALRLLPAIMLLAGPAPLAAQQAPAEPPKAATPAPAASPEPAKPDASKADAAPNAGTPAAETPAEASDDGSIKTEEITARVAIQSHGSAKWEDGYAKITEAIAGLRAAAAKAGLKETGRPLAVFTDTDDAGFKFDAMLPVDAPADAKPDLGADISMAETPSGKALKFQHRGAYDDIDSTYEAITAYLDEKGLEARNLFEEEYVGEAKDSSDMALQVDIHVFVK